MELMALFPLSLFPPGSLASSIITTVWVGVWVIVFFNLRFGWVLSGLVVPGYLVPLLILKPWAALTIGIEAVVTYALVWGFSEYFSRFGGWSSLFGRDRFFALVLVSVIVRIGFDGWLLPHTAAWLNAAFDLQFDYHSHLHSFGLVIIALLANQFWKTGLWRGLLPFLVTTGLTYLLVRYGLMELTNFAMSNISYMYEDIATSMLASPKSYIVLLLAALLASRLNLLYGWDFAGILIPSLLALQWHWPGKILATFGEALVILLLAHLVLRLPWYRHVSVEGARKLLLFFNIGFVYKLVLGYLIVWWFPQVRVTDTYGFGYLLGTLMALKMHDKDIAVRLLRAVLQTSLTAFAVASVIGFALTLLPSARLLNWQSTAPASSGPVPRRSAPLSEVLQTAKVTLYAQQTAATARRPPTPAELAQFSAALRLLQSYRQQPDPTLLRQARGRLNQLGYQLAWVESRYLYLAEQAPGRGWGLYVLDMQTANRLVIEAPKALTEPGTLEAARLLFEQFTAAALAIGVPPRGPATAAAVGIRAHDTLLQRFHQVMAARDVLQVRRYTSASRRALFGKRRQRPELQAADPEPSLWIKGELPQGLHLARLRALTEELALFWRAPAYANVQRATTRTGFAELILSRAALRHLQAMAGAGQGEAAAKEVGQQRIDGYLMEWLLTGKHLLADRGSNAYQPPRLAALLYFDEAVLTPLLQTLRADYRQGEWRAVGLDTLRAVAAAAAVFDYRLVQYRHQGTGEDFLILTERAGTRQPRYWGTYVFRLGQAAPYLLQVPRPLYETNSFEYAVAQFERLKARALLIAGTHPDANTDGSADLVLMSNQASLFTLTNQVILRETAARPLLVLHSRALGYRPDTPAPNTDIVIACSPEIMPPLPPSPLLQQLLTSLRADGLHYRFYDGSPALAGYDVYGVAQYAYLEATENKRFCALWIAPEARAEYRQQRDNRIEQATFEALGIASRERDLWRYLSAHSVAPSTLPAGVSTALERYLQSRDPVTLRRLQQQWPSYRLTRLLDRNTQQSLLVVRDAAGAIRLVMNLHPRTPASRQRQSLARLDRASVQRFLDSRRAHLEFLPPP